jgi:hypothetical protein
VTRKERSTKELRERVKNEEAYPGVQVLVVGFVFSLSQFGFIYYFEKDERLILVRTILKSLCSTVLYS